MAHDTTRDRQDQARLANAQAEADRRVLSARAEALARPALDRAARAQPGKMFLEFSIGRQAHAVDGAFVLEVFIPGEITPVPGVPEFVLGVTPWRGEILPVVDLGTACGLAGPAHSSEPADTAAAGRTPVVVVGRGEAACGVVVTAVTGACRLFLDDLAQVEDGAGLFLLGMAPGNVIVIDLERLLQSERLVVSEADPSRESI